MACDILIGDIVSISPDSEYYDPDDASLNSSNPPFIFGEVIERQDHEVGHYILVRWANGQSNCYRPEDLSLDDNSHLSADRTFDDTEIL
jgi:hypothetical protein